MHLTACYAPEVQGPDPAPGGSRAAYSRDTCATLTLDPLVKPNEKVINSCFVIGINLENHFLEPVLPNLRNTDFITKLYLLWELNQIQPLAIICYFKKTIL